MAIIDPEGLFEGERLAACSDIAQLYWQRLFLAANSCGRMQLSYQSIVSKVFKTFKNPPSEAELWSVFEELERFYLAILYEIDGVWWCQFVTSEKYLPKYKKARDESTPAPPMEAIKFHAESYRNWKKQNSFKNQSFRKFPQGFQKSSEDFLRRGIGEVVGEVEAKELEKRGAKKEAPPEPTAYDASFSIREIVCAHPKSLLRNLAPNEVSHIQESSVLDAMSREIARANCSEREALDIILRLTQQLADKVPRNEWRFFKDVPEFFRNLDYRVEPENFMRSVRSGNGKPEGNKPTSRERVESGSSGFRQAARASAEATAWGDVSPDDGGVPTSGSGTVGPGIPDGVRGSSPGVRDAPTGKGSPGSTQSAEVFPPSQRSPRGA